jgi:Mrp family chromosome partitioning ATPase
VSAVAVVTIGAGAAWEAAFVRTAEAGAELECEVVQRAVDWGDALEAVVRTDSRALLVDANGPRAGIEILDQLQGLGVAAVIVGEPRVALPDHPVFDEIFPAAALPAELAAALRRAVGRSAGTGVRSRTSPVFAAGRVVAVWGSSGAPGRTAVAVHLAVDAARGGARALLVDGDVWAPSVAQLLGLDEDPGLARAARLVTDGDGDSMGATLQRGPAGLEVLAGLPRVELWPEVRERVFADLLGAARERAALVVVDLSSPIEEDEALAFDRVPYRRNVVTRRALTDADEILVVTGGDPIALRRAIVAFRTLEAELPDVARRAAIVVNRAPRAPRRLQEISTLVEEWTGRVPAAFLPEEPAMEQTRWEGRPLQEIAARSRWLAALRQLARPEAVAA